MKCSHCRASAGALDGGGELDTSECLRIIDSLSGGRPMIIWTGGEPMMRDDLALLVRRATDIGLRSVLAPCGAFASEDRLRALAAAGVSACSFSVDCPDRASHDSFRGVEGAWDSVHAAMAAARAANIPFQVNTTVRKESLASLDRIYRNAMEAGASRLDLFFLVPTGRGSAIRDQVPDDHETASVIKWSEGKSTKLTCCPSAGTCIGGRGFAFLSYRGDLQTCGFVQTPCGNIRDFDFDFERLVAAAENPLGPSGGCRSPAPSASGRGFS